MYTCHRSDLICIHVRIHIRTNILIRTSSKLEIRALSMDSFRISWELGQV